MHSCRDKRSRKGMVKNFIVAILILTASFLLILTILNTFKGKAEAKTTEAICRGSVVLREKSYTEIRDPLVGAKLVSAATPLLCRTTDKYIAEGKKDATKEEIMMEISESMARCWWQFGEGLINDVFKEANYNNNCFVCYNVVLKKTGSFPEGAITQQEMIKYLFETPYRVESKSDNCKAGGGICSTADTASGCNEIDAQSTYKQIDKSNQICRSKNPKEKKENCCFTSYSCLNNGGKCSSDDLTAQGYRHYDKWECPSSMTCYVNSKIFYSYGDYIQRFGGNGKIIQTDDIKAGETYSVSYGSHTGKDCGWCTAIAGGFGVASGASVAALAFGLSNTVGWVAVAGAVGYLAYSMSKEDLTSLSSIFSARSFPVLYISKLSTIQSGNFCSIISDIRDT